MSKTLFSKIKKFLKSPHVRDQIRSTITDVLMIAFVLFSGEAALLLNAFYAGDYSKATVYGLLTLLFRSIVRAVLIRAFPEIFPRPDPLHGRK